MRNLHRYWSAVGRISRGWRVRVLGGETLTGREIILIDLIALIDLKKSQILMSNVLARQSPRRREHDGERPWYRDGGKRLVTATKRLVVFGVGGAFFCDGRANGCAPSAVESQITDKTYMTYMTDRELIVIK